MFRNRNLFLIILFFILLVGCAGTPVRPALKENLTIPPGKIEENQFAGIRYPFNVSAPPNWKMTMEFPDFLEELGYDKPSPMDREQTELYLYNPETKSSIQFDFTPAGRYSTFTQEFMERLTTIATGSLKGEVEKDYGNNIDVRVGPTEPVSLKGVQFAAQKSVTYIAKGLTRKQGWIYGFTEPYQIFVLYMILEKESASDHEELKRILDSFEFIHKK